MAKRVKNRAPRSSGSTLHANEWLLVLSVFTFLVAVLLVGVSIRERTSAGESITASLLAAELGTLVVGAALAALFLALSWLLRTLDGLGRSMDRLRNVLESDSRSGAQNGANRRQLANGGVPPETFREMRELLEEIRDNTLLDDEQKRERWSALLAQRKSTLCEAIEERIGQKRFVDAAHDLERFEELFGSDENTTELRRKLDSARQLAEKRDLAEALENYISQKANREFDSAVRSAEALLNTYPHSIEARKWLEQIHRDREQITVEHRKALVRETQEFSERREWRRALATARTLIETYPDSPDARSIHSQIETLEFNAGVEIRQELEEQIKVLVGKGEFADAVELANQLIVRYPDSPQADALRNQLPRLRDRIARAAG